MLESLLKNLRSLEKTEISIRAEGEYPDRGTPVQDVAVYQNDGTEYIKASHFVERKARSKRGWASPMIWAYNGT
jgi:hypothetical protein